MEDNPRGQASIRAGIALAFIVTLAVLLRLLARSKSRMNFGADDWVILASVPPLYVMVVVGILLCKNAGLGSHLNVETRQQVLDLTKVYSHASSYTRSAKGYELTAAYKLFFPTLLTYSLAITLARTSILLFYHRIFPLRSFHIATYIVGGICSAWFIAETLVTIFQCRPTAGAWDASIKRKCLKFNSLYYGIGISNLLVDILVLCLPLGMVWRLMLPVRKKVLVSAIFMLGSLVCVASLGRIISISTIKAKDISYTLLVPYTYSTLEPAIAIICACLPTFGPLFQPPLLPPFLSRFKPRAVPKSIRDSTSTGSSGASKGVPHGDVVDVGAAPLGRSGRSEEGDRGRDGGITVRTDVTVSGRCYGQGGWVEGDEAGGLLI
ncbi:hypothetical protein MMC12_003239 [Toensbergia leucococca]|nr:hypothetical protein [Toensbergia leucococca]